MPSVRYEVEQKFPLEDAAAVKAALGELGAQFGEPVEQQDRYFRHPSRDFAQTDEALRTRRAGKSNYVTYKGPKIGRADKTRQEIELPLPDGEAFPDQFSELLQALGFEPLRIVRKWRRTAVFPFQDWIFEAAVDNVAELGTFLELETSAAEDGLAAAQACLAELQRRLDLPEPERKSYLELLLQRKD